MYLRPLQIRLVHVYPIHNKLWGQVHGALVLHVTMNLIKVLMNLIKLGPAHVN